jgi:triphosphoribosyl-dephospho-CoA synthase
MQAAQFRASARAAADPLFEPGARVGARIEAAQAASWAAAGCNTNLGILLLCAPLALALECHSGAGSAAELRQAIEVVLAGLDLADSRAAFRAIARASPGGLGSAEAEDVHQPPSLDLRAAMTLAAGRDSIARQYSNGYTEIFEIGLPALRVGWRRHEPSASAVQRLFLTLLGAMPDSHIVRKHGPVLAQTVMRAAQAWLTRLARPGEDRAALDEDPAFLAWDERLKREGINPGTTADLCVATLMLHVCLGPGGRD